MVRRLVVVQVKAGSIPVYHPMSEAKYCPKCKQTKPVSEFHKRGEYLMGYCKPCQCAYVNAKRKIRNKRLQDFIKNLKESSPCMDCKEFHPYWAMDFDHRDPKEKSFNLSKAKDLCWDEDAVMREIVKCDLVCALCHRYRTHGQRRQRAVV